MTAEQRKEKRPDIDRDDVVFADGGVSYEIKYPEYSEDEIYDNVKILAEANSVYTVSENKLEKTGKRPSDLFDEFFNSIGNNIYSEEFGDIEIGHASTKSEIRHGITAEKIASVEAIPSVISDGKVIYYKKAYKENLDRIVISAPIKIGKTPYYMGVMLQRDNNTQRLYLHNVAYRKRYSQYF